MKILQKINYHLLPFSYKLWEKELDERYYKINKNLRKDWLNTQHSIFSGMLIPFIILLVTVIFFILTDFSIENQIVAKIFFYFAMYFIVFTIITITFIDRYCDKKYFNNFK